jgi:ion transport protein
VVGDALTEKLMVFLSLVTLPGTLYQLLGLATPAEATAFDLLDWGVVSIFAVEYVSKLYLAVNRTTFAKSPWNVLNLSIVLLAFTGFLAATPILYSAPLLRVVRTAKLLTESEHATSGSVQERKEPKLIFHHFG